MPVDIEHQHGRAFRDDPRRSGARIRTDVVRFRTRGEKLVDRLDATTQTLRTADGRSLCFADWGNSEGYPVFSLHGSPGCRLSVRGVELVTALGGRRCSSRLASVA